MALTKIITDTIDLSSDTTALKMPKGTTAERPGSQLSSVDYLIVAGGGGGGGYGGGGAGGLLTTYTPVSGTTPGQSQTKISLTVGTTYTITVGDGGAGNVIYVNPGVKGDDSIISGSDITTITATGGGYGNKSNTYAAGDGGSGGGAGYNASGAPPGAAIPAGQGYAGSDGAPDIGVGYRELGGGGGGASETPANAGTSNGIPGPGGEGTTIDITGSSVGYAGGGGGVNFDGTAGLAPTVGGGGAGANWGGSTSNLSPVYAGTDGKGGGGGSGGDGGCGIIYIRLPGITSGDVTILSGSAAKGNVSSDAFVKLDTAGTATFKITSNGETSTTGTLRENTTTGKMEIYTGAKGWRALQQTRQDVGIVPSNNFNTVLYVGNRPSNNIITGVGFQPGFTWIKDIDAAESNTLFDNVRGAYALESNTESVQSNFVGYFNFDSDGFTVGDSGQINTSSNNIVSWNWKARRALI